MKLRTIALTLMYIISATFLFGSTKIVNLQTEYQTTPLGIDDAQPRFNWQMSSQRIGACQNAYRLLVAESDKNLNSGDYVYDTERVNSDISVGVVYRGSVLKPSTRYFWKVQVWDEQGNMAESKPSWFETGLMGAGWNRAEWIGSSDVMLSKYRTFFLIDFDLRIAKGSDRAVFVYSAKDADNYIFIEVNLSGKNGAELSINHCVEGVEHRDFTEDISKVITTANKYDKHSLHLKITTPGYHLMSFLDVSIDGVQIENNNGVERARNATGRFTINPYPNGERVHDYARLHSIGFRQPKGQKATFSNIVISEDNWNTTLYVDPIEEHSVVGTGNLEVWEPYGHISAPMLRKSVVIEKSVKRARLYTTARGALEFYVNNKRVGNDYFNPGWTDFRYRIMYSTYDITDMLRQGDNGFGAMLGAGWYSDLNIFTARAVDPYGIRQSIIAKIVIDFEDGTSQTVITDSSWKRWDYGPITRNGFQFGEDYDARKEVDGWAGPDFDDSKWSDAVIFERPAPNVVLQSHVGIPIRNHITLNAISVSEPIKGTFVYDLGKNIVGVPRLEGMKGLSGQLVNIRFGEMVYPEIIPVAPVEPYTIETYKKMKGQVYIENYRGAISIDNYIMRGKPEGESYQPYFTHHGFRYISITGLETPLPLESVKGVVLESIGYNTNHYQTSNDNINRLFENILWGQRGNFLSIPTDCPQRDERVGWTGDAQVFARAATYFSNDIDQFYTRWLYSMRDNQNRDGSYANYYPTVGNPPYGSSADAGAGSMGWMEAGIIVPWQVYQQFADTRILEQHYNSMVRYMNFLDLRADNFIQPIGSLGDHLAIEPTNNSLTNTAYYAYDAWIMARVADALKNKEDAERFNKLYENIKEAFNKRFVNDHGVTVAPYTPPLFRFGRNTTPAPDAPKPGDIIAVNTQTSYIVPLQANLFNEKNKPHAIKHLVDNIKNHNNTLTTGFIGTPYLNSVLSVNGESDMAYTLIEQTAYPSWLYPVLQGATTMWERWNSYTIENGFGPVDMNSFNHYAYGAIQEWMMSHSLGIERDINNPGYKHIILQPKVGGRMTFAKGGFESVYGSIESCWTKVDGGYTYNVTIPANTTATLTLECQKVSAVSILAGADGVGLMKENSGKVVCELKSGTYEFKVSQ